MCHIVIIVRSFFMKEIEASSLKNIIDTFPFSGEPVSIKSTDTGLIN